MKGYVPLSLPLPLLMPGYGMKRLAAPSAGSSASVQRLALCSWSSSSRMNRARKSGTGSSVKS